MVWKKKLRSPQYTFNSERVFLVATQPGKSIYSCLQTTKPVSYTHLRAHET